MAFNNREIASAVWLALFFAWAVTHSPVRDSLRRLIRTAVTRKIIVPLGLMAAYTFAVAAGLRAVGLWTPSLIKDTILWFVLSGVALLVTFVTDDNSDGILRGVLADSVKVVLVVEFLVGTYTFSLVAELALVPFLAFLAALDAYARTRSECTDVAKVTTGLLGIVGFAVLASAVHKAIEHFETLASVDSARQILLAPVLSTALVPFIYGFVLYARYEMLFIRLGPVGEELDPRVRLYAKRRLIGHLKLSVKRINRFLRAHGLALMRIRTKQDVDELLKAYRS